MCNLFEEYVEVLEMVPLEFSEGDVTWVASKISGVAGDLRLEVIEIRNWLIHFGCMLEEVKVVIINLDDLMANYSLPGLPTAYL